MIKMENTKRNLSLDFTKPRHRGNQQPPSLVTPILNLSTPEIYKMIPEDEHLTDLTPNTISSVIPQSTVLPSPLIPTTVNSNNIINNNNNISNGTGNISQQSNNNSNGNLFSNGNQNHNNSQNTNTNNNINKKSDNGKSRDADLDKIEKKRERNRLAAKKCRQRKLETIDELRKTVSEWEQKYHRLEQEYEAILRENNELKGLIRRQ